MRPPALCQVISVAAGVTLKTMEEALGPHVRVVRVMPNTPALGALVRCWIAWTVVPSCTLPERQWLRLSRRLSQGPTPMAARSMLPGPESIEALAPCALLITAPRLAQCNARLLSG